MSERFERGGGSVGKGEAVSAVVGGEVPSRVHGLVKDADDEDASACGAIRDVEQDVRGRMASLAKPPLRRLAGRKLDV
jgi:hypothetical protein